MGSNVRTVEIRLGGLLVVNRNIVCFHPGKERMDSERRGQESLCSLERPRVGKSKKERNVVDGSRES